MDNTQKITVETAEKYSWAHNCDGWHLLNSDSLSVIRERMGPGTAEKLHYHNNAQQLFYILTGEAVFELEERETLLNAGECIHVLPGKTHRVFNRTSHDLHFLVISSPKAHGDRVNVVE